MKQLAFRMLGMTLLLCSGRIQADTLVGQNGERIAGRFVEEKNGRIVFVSDVFGRLDVSSAMARVEHDAGTAESRPLATQATQEGKSPGSASPPHWTMDVGVKLNVDRGSLKTNEDKLDTRLTWAKQTRRGELHGKLAYKYKATESDLRDNDWLGSLAYDWFVSKRRFNAARMTLNSELTDSGYDTTQTVSAATGWRLWEAPDHYLRIGPSLGYLAITRGEQEFNGAGLGLYARGMTPLLGRSRLTGELQLLDTLGEGRHATVALRITRPLTERLLVSLGWDYVWSDFDIESGVTSEWRWDIGWRFGPTEAD